MRDYSTRRLESEEVNNPAAKSPFAVIGKPTILAHMKRVFFSRLRLGRFNDGTGRICLDVEFVDADGDGVKWTPGWVDLCGLVAAAWETEYSNEGENQHTRRLAAAVHNAERGRRLRHRNPPEPVSSVVQHAEEIVRQVAHSGMAYCIECEWHTTPDGCCYWCYQREACHQR